MIVFFWLAFGVGVAGLLALLVLRMRAARDARETVARAEALTPVAAGVQDAVRWHLDQRQRGQAVRMVRRTAGLGLAEATAVVDVLGAGRTVPTTYQASVDVLNAEHPELAAQLRQLAGEGQMLAAMRLLRGHAPISLVHAKHLIDALAR